MPKTKTTAIGPMRLISVPQARLDYLANQESPLKMATHVSYAEIAALVAEVYEMRRTFGPLRRELVLPIY